MTAPVLFAIILHNASNKEIMGENTNSKLSNILGIAALVIMTMTAGTLLYLEFIE